MQAEAIRAQFIHFFERKGHQRVQAAPVVNKEDPTLLFTNAGMNQFKAFFLGSPPPYPRAVSAQPCLRVSGKHNDLEEVGIDTYHHTLFEMLGNWSFGDYFKEEAIQWAWELLTEVYQLPPERFYITVYAGDSQDGLAADEASEALWQRHVAPSHILRCAKKDNFWEMGDTGPCGPCTEIHIDLRPAQERQRVPGKTLVNKDHPQVIELWNLVFIQYNRLASGQLVALPTQHVDTGLGLERLAMVLQAKASNYETDLFTPIVQSITQAAHYTYGQDPKKDIATRVVADHVRAVTFAIADGQPPSNVKAGYVVRRILRRAVRYGYTYLGFQAPFMHRLVPVLVQQLQRAYPHLRQEKAYIEKVVQDEEAAFLKTLTAGLQRLDRLQKALPPQAKVIPGKAAFELYDTYGFPLDLTALIAKERGLVVDEQSFEEALQAQRQRSKKAAAVETSDWVVVDKAKTGQPSKFLGYDHLETTTHIVQYRTTKVQEQARYHIVLDQTPFYAEGGGQVGDTGYLTIGTETLPVLDTQKENDLILHCVAQLPTHPATPVRAMVDKARRILVASNHTATHLLHAALRQCLGDHVVQRGSLVNDQMLRFDFAHTAKLSPQEITAIEERVNQQICANIPLEEHRNIPLAEAKAMGAQRLFGEKYGTQVRVITFDPNYSVELCGGTHVPATGYLGFFKITASTAVAAGVRRVEAITAKAATQYIHQQTALIQALQELLRQPKDLEKAVQQLVQEKASLVKQLAHHEAQELRKLVSKLQGRFQQRNKVQYLLEHVTLPNAAALRQVTNTLTKVPGEAPHFIVLTATIDQRPHIAVALSEGLAQQWPHNARNIVQQLAKLIEGGGGGGATLATAGGKNTQNLPQVLQRADGLLDEYGGAD